MNWVTFSPISVCDFGVVIIPECFSMRAVPAWHKMFPSV